MTQEDKELLSKDLAARLPYNLYVRVEEFNAPKDEAITEGFVGNYLKDNRCNDYDADDILNELADDCINVKPYLRPMSSMTEEECMELSCIRPFDDEVEAWKYIKTPVPLKIANIKHFDFFHSHHLDWRGLIERGLALEAPEGMYK